MCGDDLIYKTEMCDDGNLKPYDGYFFNYLYFNF